METKEKASGQVKTNGQFTAEGQEPKKAQAPAFANNNPVNKESVKDKQNPEKPQGDKADDKTQIKVEKKVGLNLESTLNWLKNCFAGKRNVTGFWKLSQTLKHLR